MAEPVRRAGINWLASYPKSGNTWMRMMLANYFAERDEPHDINSIGVTNGIASSRRRFDEVIGIDSADLTHDEELPLRHHVFRHVAARGETPIWMKVHDAQARLADGQWLFPQTASHGAIYLIRNPLDVAVSYAFHSAKEIEIGVRRICDPGHVMARRSRHQLPQFTGSWSDHVASWVDQDAIPVCVIRYEDMLADPAAQLTRALAAGRPDIAIDPARVALAVERSRFDKLQAAEAERGFREKFTGSERFFRSGRVDDWLNHLNREQVERICAMHDGMMRRFGYDPDVLQEKLPR